MLTPLIPKPMRSALRDHLCILNLAVIRQAFEDQGFEIADFSYPAGTPQRRRMLIECEASVDWGNPEERNRAVAAYSVLIRRAAATMNDFDQESYFLSTLREEVERYEGWKVTETKELSPRYEVPFVEGSLNSLPSAEVVHQHLQRQVRNVEQDPQAAIGASKELLESMAKIVLTAEKQPLPEKFPALITAAEKMLLLHEKSERGDRPELEPGFRAVLQGLHQIAVGTNMVRGTERSTGHGHAQPLAGLSSRHARLIVGAAQLWCQIVLDTYSDPQAPWRKKPAAGRDGGID